LYLTFKVDTFTEAILIQRSLSDHLMMNFTFFYNIAQIGTIASIIFESLCNIPKVLFGPVICNLQCGSVIKNKTSN